MSSSKWFRLPDEDGCERWTITTDYCRMSVTHFQSGYSRWEVEMGDRTAGLGRLRATAEEAKLEAEFCLNEILKKIKNSFS